MSDNYFPPIMESVFEAVAPNAIDIADIVSVDHKSDAYLPPRLATWVWNPLRYSELAELAEDSRQFGLLHELCTG